jgi:hypothetical protein
MKPNKNTFAKSFLALALISTSAPVQAVDTTWTAFSGDWNDPLNWSNGVANNGVDNFNAFVPSGSINIYAPVTIDNLEIGGPNDGVYLWVSNVNFTVLQTTTLTGGQNKSIGVSANSASSIVDLGQLPQFVANTLDGFNLIANGSGGFDATIQWQGADIHTIGSNANMALIGATSFVRNNVDSSNALAGLQANDGRLEIIGRELSIAGNFSNTGILYASSSATEARITINGALAQNTGGILTAGTLRISGGFEAGTLEWQGAEINVIGGDATVRLEGTGSILNSLDSSDALAGLHTNEGSFEVFERTFTTAGNFSNTGYLTSYARGQNTLLSINGGLAQNAGGVLSNGVLELFSYNGFSATIEWENAEIHTIGSGAGITLAGPDSQIRNSLDASDALAGLHTNEGWLSIYDRTFATPGNLSNTGILSALAFNVDTTISINGALAQNSGGILTAGEISVSAYGGFLAAIEWEGAEIHTIGSGARISITGSDSHIRNSLDSSDALAGLHTNEGTLVISDRDFTTAGDFTNSGYLSVNQGTLATSAGGNFIIDSNSTIEIGISGLGDFGAINADGLVTLDGIFSVNLWSFAGDPLLIIDPTEIFTVITGDVIVGAFDNIASGERLVVDGGEYSFLFTVTEQNVFLSDFAVIPEPGTVSLLILTGALFGIRRRRG